MRELLLAALLSAAAAPSHAVSAAPAGGEAAYQQAAGAFSALDAQTVESLRARSWAVPEPRMTPAGAFDDILDELLRQRRERDERRRRDPWDEGRRWRRCIAVDAHSEEHFGGHRDCDDCFRRHGSCDRLCEAEEYSCTARWYDRDGVPGGVLGRGRDEEERYAEYDAVRDCELRNAPGGYCRLEGLCRRDARMERAGRCRGGRR